MGSACRFGMDHHLDEPLRLVQEFIGLGAVLAAEKGHGRLPETILEHAECITDANGGTLDSTADDDTLSLEILHGGSLDIRQGGSSDVPVCYRAIPLAVAADGADDQSRQRTQRRCTVVEQG
jgi:hypothetical protein